MSTGPYSAKVMDHFMNPRNVGEMDNPDGVGQVGNPVCVLPETLIHGNSKIVRIKDINMGSNVLGHDGRYHEVSNIYENDYTGEVYSILTHNLGKTTTTPDHHILALRTSGFAHKKKAAMRLIPDWMLAEELKKGDVVLYPIPLEEKDISSLKFNIDKPKWDFKSKKLPEKILVNDEFLRLAGYYLAEGYVRTDKCQGTLGFVFCDKEIGYLTDVIFIMKRLFGLEPSSLRNKHNAATLEYYSARLARFFDRLFGKGAAAKSLPHWMVLLPPEKQRSIICGMWRGDGYVNNKGSKYVTISRDLAYQLKLLLLRQKIVFSFLTTKEKGINKEHYSLYVKEEESLRKLASIVGIEIDRPLKKKNPKKSWFDEKYYYVPIREVNKEAYSGKIYNLKVENSHSYASASLALHNCGDIMKMYIKVKNNIITDVKFQTFGCGSAIATSSMATELIKGKSIEEALKLTNVAVAEALDGLPKIKMHCSVLAEEAVQAAIDDYLKKTTGKGLPGYKPHEESLHDEVHGE